VCIEVRVTKSPVTPYDGTYGSETTSYRQQIARKLRTQYDEGIYKPKYYTVTLKSRFTITRGYWK